MKISELLERLGELQGEHGNIEVFYLVSGWQPREPILQAHDVVSDEHEWSKIILLTG